MRAPALGLFAALLLGPGAAGAQTSAPPAQAASGATTAADPAKPAPQLMDAAQRHYDDAIQFFKAGRFDAARVEFEASYALSKEPDLLYNLSTTAEKQGQLVDAIRYAERYLEAKPNADDAAVVRERISHLRTQQQPAVRGAAGAAPTLPPSAASLDPGPGSDRMPASGSGTVPKPAVGLLCVGAGMLLAGLGTGAAALATDKQVSGMEMIYFGELQELDRRGTALNTAAITLSVVGGAAVVAGGSWLIARKVRAR